MATTLDDMNTLVNDRRRDTSNDSIDMTGDGFRAINGALDLWQQFHDWPWTIEKYEFNYNPGIDRYDVPSDFKNSLDMEFKKPPHSTEFSMVSQSNFDSEITKSNRFAIEQRSQVEQIRIEANRGNMATVHTLSSIDNNGTSSVSGAASNLATDSYESFEQPASVSFDYSGTSGIITIENFSQTDIDRYVDRGNMYVNAYLGSVTNFTSLAIEIGSGSSNYFSETVTTDYLGDTVDTTGWNRFKFTPWDSETGTVDTENIDYVKFTLKYSSDPDTKMRLENLFVSENVPIVFEYYSINMVQDAGDDTKRAKFDDSSATSDTFLWTGKRDYINEAFVNSVLELIFWMTGEYTDKQEAEKNIARIVGNLRTRLPSRQRQPELQMYVE